MTLSMTEESGVAGPPLPAASSGAWLVGGAFLAWIVAVGASFALHGAGEEGLRVAVRTTARLSAVLLAVTFATSSLNALARSGSSKWLLRNRRHLGLGFAVMHFGHLGVVLALALLHTASFRATTAMSSVAGGSIGYVWLAAMTVTSFDGTRKRIGPRAWRALHTSGMWVLWAIFVFSYVGRAFSQVIHAVFLGVMLSALGVRVASRLRGRTGNTG